MNATSAEKYGNLKLTIDMENHLKEKHKIADKMIGHYVNMEECLFCKPETNVVECVECDRLLAYWDEEEKTSWTVIPCDEGFAVDKEDAGIVYCDKCFEEIK